MRDALRRVLYRARRGNAARAKELLQALIYGSIDSLVSHLPRSNVTSGVLVVRLDNIGDFILWLRSAVALRAQYPGQRIVLAANRSWAALARQLPYWDEVIAIDVARLKGNPVHRLRTFVAIRRLGFSVAVQPNYSRLFFLGDAVVRVSGARERKARNQHRRTEHCKTLHRPSKRITNQVQVSLTAPS